MAELTVAIVAGIIAACIFIIHEVFPLCMVILLSYVLGNKSSAASWSAASAAFHQSRWPMLLRSDGTRSRHVPWHVQLATSSLLIGAVIIAIASIVTPLGLYSSTTEGQKAVADFVYAEDSSPFGFGTPARTNLAFTRICTGGYFDAPCPYTDSVRIDQDFSNRSTSATFPYGLNIDIPSGILHTFASDNKSTISNSFDIQWRRYSTKNSSDYNNGSTYQAGSASNMRSIVLDDKILVVEGLIVDARSGGIGFRNHTIPTGFPHNVTWEEDLLFVEPDTVCVDTNLTIDYTIRNENASVASAIYITDRGGFTNLNRTVPIAEFNHTPDGRDLYSRAYIGAWFTNAYAALYFNVTNPNDGTRRAFSYFNSSIGRTFQVGSGTFGIDGFDSLVLAKASDFFSRIELTDSTFGVQTPANPFGLGRSNWTFIDEICSGLDPGDYPGINSTVAACGLMRSVPHRVDTGSSLLFETGSTWSQKIFSCATAVKASVKTVAFSHDQQNQLNGLSVSQITPRTYSSQAEMPIWGVENTGKAYYARDIQLIWGLVSQAVGTNVSTVQQPTFNLPGYFDWSNPLTNTLTPARQNLPASDFSIRALQTVYSVEAQASGKYSFNGVSAPINAVDYTGQSSLAMFARWQELTMNASSASLIANLIFTDAVANTVVGTKGADPAQRASLQILVTPTRMTVRYQWVYGIPAFVILALFIVVSVLAVFTTIFSSGTLSRLKKQVTATSPGRIYTAYLFPEQGIMQLSPASWSRQCGAHDIDISGPVSRAPDSDVATSNPRYEALAQDESREDKDPAVVSTQSLSNNHHEHERTSTTGRE